MHTYYPVASVPGNVGYISRKWYLLEMLNSIACKKSYIWWIRQPRLLLNPSINTLVRIFVPICGWPLYHTAVGNSVQAQIRVCVFGPVPGPHENKWSGEPSQISRLAMFNHTHLKNVGIPD